MIPFRTIAFGCANQDWHYQVLYMNAMAVATTNPQTVTNLMAFPPCANASGIIVSANIVSIASAAKGSASAPSIPHYSLMIT
jgi:hypothetical protein